MKVNRNGTERKQDASYRFKKIVKRVMEHKLSFALTLIISFTISCLYIITIPRYYSTDTQLAPEIESSMETSTLGSLASSFGFDMSKMNSQDAITPLLYPELMKDNKFVYSFFPIKVKSQDGKIETNYFEYLSKYQKCQHFTLCFLRKRTQRIWISRMRKLIHMH